MCHAKPENRLRDIRSGSLALDQSQYSTHIDAIGSNRRKINKRRVESMAVIAAYYFTLFVFFHKIVLHIDSSTIKCETKYPQFSKSERLKLRDEAKRMFYFGYDNYMEYAFPKDELDPIHCTGRGPDYSNP